MTRPNPNPDSGSPSLEIIQVRGSVASASQAEAQLRDLLRSPGSQGVRCYRNAATPQDLSVHLTGAAGDPEAGAGGGAGSGAEGASPLGLRIAAALREFGWVRHSVWKRLDEPLDC